MSYKIISPVPINEGGTNAITMATTDGTVIFDGTRLVTTATGTAGQLLTSNGAGVAPTYQTGAASSITLTGDTGGALSGSAFTVFANTAANNSGSSVSISGSATTLTLNLTDSLNNTLLGKTVGNATISGNNNTAVGYTTLNILTSGDDNVAFGDVALSTLTSGESNTAFGTSSLGNIGTGSFNTSLGGLAGLAYNLADSSNISIGYNTQGIAGQSNILRIGVATGFSSGQVNKAFICGIDGVNVGSVAKVVTMASDQLGTAAITAGTGISVTPGANTITIAATGTAFTWAVITVDQTAVINNGYICNKAGTLALLLPATAAIGDTIQITGINTATGWQITQNANQQIFIGTGSTTVGVGGSITSTAIRDSIELLCVVAGSSTVWNVLDFVGNLTLV